ncbi:MAG: TAXI family TRAP transporter solute-binding subunit [Pseudomonadota bacterium]
MKLRFDKVKIREWLIVIGPAALLVLVAFAITTRFIEPAPPRTIVMTAGAEGGAYDSFARKYKGILARDDITLDIRSSAGAGQNLERLRDVDSEFSVGFVQSGVGSSDADGHLLSLGRMYHEPLWVFHRLPGNVDRLPQLQGKRLAIGAPGSGTRSLALQLLAANGIGGSAAILLELGSADAAAALLAGKADAAFMVASPEAAAVQKMLREPGVKLMSFAHAEAYARRFPFLSKVVLPQGMIDFARNIPAQDMVLISPTANLVIKNDLHPALIFALTQTASAVHGKAGVFQAEGEFPAGKDAEFPMSADAARYYKSGPPFLQRYLPFWIAVLADRLLVLLLPLLTVLLPLMKFAPMIYGWRIRRRMVHWYAELKALEQRMGKAPADSDAHLADLARIEEAVVRLPIPVGFSDQHYELRSNIDFVRRRLAG